MRAAMRVAVMVLGLALGMAAAVSAQCPNVNLSATGGGYYVVVVNGDTVSQHTTERAAAARGITEKMRNPAAFVAYHLTSVTRVEGCLPLGRVDTVTVRDTVVVVRVDTVVVRDSVIVPPPVDTVTPPPVDTVVTPPVDTVSHVPLPTDTISPTGYAPRAVWTPARQAVWSRMARERHPLFVRAEEIAGMTDTPQQRYGDDGVYATWMYQATGDTTFGRKAARLALAAAVDTARNANGVRDGLLRDVLRWEWLRPVLTPAEDATLQAALQQSARYVMGRGTPKYEGGIRIGDGDAVAGYYFGIALLDVLTRDIPGTPRWLDSTSTPQGGAHLAIGGLVATDTGRTTLRNAVAWYGRHNAGGVWDESTEYNFSTVGYLALGTEALRTALGVDHFPEVTAFLADAVTAEAFALSNDLNYGVQWGDIQAVRSLIQYRRLNTLAALGGVTGDPLAMTLFRAIEARHGLKTENLMGRAYWMVDPYLGDAPIPTGGFVAEGRGHLYVKNGETHAYLAASNRSREDHDHRHVHDVQIYCGGEPCLARPINYGSPSSDHWGPNGVSYAGFGTMFDGGFVRADSGDGWWSITGATGGPLYGEGYYNPPATFLRLGQRTAIYSRVGTSEVVVTRDTVDISDPRTMASYSRIRAADQSLVEQAGGAWWSVWHPRGSQPVVGACGCKATWTTQGGQSAAVYWFADAPVTTEIVDEALLWTGNRPAASEKHWQLRLTTPGVLFQVVVIGDAVPTREGDTITVGSQAWTITSAGVTGP